MNIQWGWNLHSCHNCHRPSFCRLLLSRFNGTIKQKVGGRSRKLFWTASILGACWPGKTSGKCHQLAISGIWECSLTATIAQYAGQIKRMHHVCSEIGCESDLVRFNSVTTRDFSPLNLHPCVKNVSRSLETTLSPVCDCDCSDHCRWSRFLPFPLLRWSHSCLFIPTQVYWLCSEPLFYPGLGVFSAVVARNSLQPSLTAVGVRTLESVLLCEFFFFSD